MDESFRQSSEPPVRRESRRLFVALAVVVAAILFLLALAATLVMPRLVSRTGQAKIAKAQADIATFSGLISRFRIDCDRYPSNDEGLGALISPPQDAKGWKGPYVEKLPQDPWNHNYAYQSPGLDGPDSYLIKSFGADGKPGGNGDDADITSAD